MLGSGKVRTRLEWDGKRTQVDKIKLPFQQVEVINEPRTKTMDTFMPRTDKWYNMMIWGDNKLVMSSLMPKFEGKVDLIYIDPPFATGANFTFPVKIESEKMTKEPTAIEIKAYRDTWGKGIASYLQMMYDRLILMRQLLSDTG
jgi:adenine-specific DNA-methyltransferase